MSPWLVALIVLFAFTGGWVSCAVFTEATAGERRGVMDFSRPAARGELNLEPDDPWRRLSPGKRAELREAFHAPLRGHGAHPIRDAIATGEVFLDALQQKDRP